MTPEELDWIRKDAALSRATARELSATCRAVIRGSADLCDTARERRLNLDAVVWDADRDQ